MNENVLAKLKVLAESAKYDVSCSSSGTVRRNQSGTLGNTVGGWGIWGQRIFLVGKLSFKRIA